MIEGEWHNLTLDKINSLKKEGAYNYFMARRLPTVMAALVLSLLIALPAAHKSYAGRNVAPKLAGSPFELINAVNALRASYGLPPYNISPILMYTAQVQADFMAANGAMTHSGPGGIGLTARLLAAGYPLAGELSAGGFRAENITGGNESMPAEDAVERWTGDALHLNTMISPDLTEIGAGVAVSGGRVYYVIDCARPTTADSPPASISGDGSGSTAPAREAPNPVAVVSTPNADGDVIHEVQVGQSLWQLAIAYNVKIEEIKGLNNLFDNNIHPGSKLLIKRGAATSTVPVTETSIGSAAVNSIVTPSPLTTATSMLPTFTQTAVPVSVSANSDTIMGVMMGIIVLALLGGGLFTWWGSSRK